MYSAVVATAGEAAMLARVAVAGVYQLGGNLEPVRWQQGASPSSSSPTLAAGVVHTMHLSRDAQLWVGPDSTAAASTQVDLWLVWPDE